MCGCGSGVGTRSLRNGLMGAFPSCSQCGIRTLQILRPGGCMTTTDTSNMLLLKQILWGIQAPEHPLFAASSSCWCGWMNKGYSETLDPRRCARLGNDVLVRAITKAGERSVDVYLPWPQTLTLWNNSQALHPWHLAPQWEISLFLFRWRPEAEGYLVWFLEYPGGCFCCEPFCTCECLISW